MCCSVLQCVVACSRVLRCLALRCVGCVVWYDAAALRLMSTNGIIDIYILIERNPPPGGVSYSLCSPIKEDDPLRRICTRCFEGGHLSQGSWLGNIVNRKPPRGGGFLRSGYIKKYDVVTIHCGYCVFHRIRHECVYVYVYVCMCMCMCVCVCVCVCVCSEYLWTKLWRHVSRNLSGL